MTKTIPDQRLINFLENSINKLQAFLVENKQQKLQPATLILNDQPMSLDTISVS